MYEENYLSNTRRHKDENYKCSVNVYIHGIIVRP